jgi:hypothetical protein
VSRGSQRLPLGNNASGTGSPAFMRDFLAHCACFWLLQNRLVQKSFMPSYWNLAKIEREHLSRYSQSAISISTISRAVHLWMDCKELYHLRGGQANGHSDNCTISARRTDLHRQGG